MLVRRKPLVAGIGVAAILGTALFIANPDLLKGDAGEAGCSAINELVDKETAYNESRFLSTEVLVAVGLGLERVDSYINTVEPLTTSPVAVTQSNEANCYQAEILELEPPGEATLALDYSGCDSEKGQVEVSIVKTYPDIELPEFDPDAPSEEPVEVPDPASIEPESVDYSLKMQEVVASGVFVEGTVAVEEQSDEERNFTISMSVDFMDYAGTLDADGTVVYEEGSSIISLVGTFRSVTGLDWQIQGTDIVVEAGCSGAKSGTLIGTFTNSVGEPLEVVSTFDGSCDGCAKIVAGGDEQSPVCLPEGIGL